MTTLVKAPLLPALSRKSIWWRTQLASRTVRDIENSLVARSVQHSPLTMERSLVMRASPPGGEREAVPGSAAAAAVNWFTA
jgi:hypothetical protein